MIIFFSITHFFACIKIFVIFIRYSFLKFGIHLNNLKYLEFLLEIFYSFGLVPAIFDSHAKWRCGVF